jgi:hypothetical protein
MEPRLMKESLEDYTRVMRGRYAHRPVLHAESCNEAERLRGGLSPASSRGRLHEASLHRRQSRLSLPARRSDTELSAGEHQGAAPNHAMPWMVKAIAPFDAKSQR